MPKLYLKEYARSLAGKKVFIACREGILRDHFQDIIADVKFISRFGARATLLHNMPNRFANQKLIRQLERKLDELSRGVDHLKETRQVQQVMGINLHYRDGAVVSFRKG